MSSSASTAAKQPQELQDKPQFIERDVFQESEEFACSTSSSSSSESSSSSSSSDDGSTSPEKASSSSSSSSDSDSDNDDKSAEVGTSQFAPIPRSSPLSAWRLRTIDEEVDQEAEVDSSMDASAQSPPPCPDGNITISEMNDMESTPIDQNEKLEATTTSEETLVPWTDVSKASAGENQADCVKKLRAMESPRDTIFCKIALEASPRDSLFSKTGLCMKDNEEILTEKSINGHDDAVTPFDLNLEDAVTTFDDNIAHSEKNVGKEAVWLESIPNMAISNAGADTDAQCVSLNSQTQGAQCHHQETDSFKSHADLQSNEDLSTGLMHIAEASSGVRTSSMGELGSAQSCPDSCLTFTGEKLEEKLKPLRDHRNGDNATCTFDWEVVTRQQLQDHAKKCEAEAPSGEKRGISPYIEITKAGAHRREHSQGLCSTSSSRYASSSTGCYSPLVPARSSLPATPRSPSQPFRRGYYSPRGCYSPPPCLSPHKNPRGCYSPPFASRDCLPTSFPGSPPPPFWDARRRTGRSSSPAGEEGVATPELTARPIVISMRARSPRIGQSPSPVRAERVAIAEPTARAVVISTTARSPRTGQSPSPVRLERVATGEPVARQVVIPKTGRSPRTGQSPSPVRFEGVATAEPRARPVVISKTAISPRIGQSSSHIRLEGVATAETTARPVVMSKTGKSPRVGQSSSPAKSERASIVEPTAENLKSSLSHVRCHASSPAIATGSRPSSPPSHKSWQPTPLSHIWCAGGAATPKASFTAAAPHVSASAFSPGTRTPPTRVKASFVPEARHVATSTSAFGPPASLVASCASALGIPPNDVRCAGGQWARPFWAPQLRVV